MTSVTSVGAIQEAFGASEVVGSFESRSCWMSTAYGHSVEWGQLHAASEAVKQGAQIRKSSSGQRVEPN